MSKYIIIDAEVIEKRLEEIDIQKRNILKIRKELYSKYGNTTVFFNSIESWNNLYSQLIIESRLLKQILSKSTPLIPEIEKAMNAAREIQDDSAHDTFTAEDISGHTEVCTYGWRYKTTNEDYISNLKLDI